MKADKDWSKIPKQTLLKEDGKIGDCWRCCVAAIIGLPAEQVPHFLEQEIKDPSRAMDADTQEWLNARGFQMVEAREFRFHRWASSRYQLPAIIAAGPSPRSKKMGDHHAVIMRAEKLLYDPHPSEAGLTYVSERYLIFPIEPDFEAFVLSRPE